MTEDITNQRFGTLIALRCIGRKCSREVWECRCDCGTIKHVAKYLLLCGDTKSCGKSALHKDSLVGRRFGLLAVLRYAGSGIGGGSRWECLCDCERIKIISSGGLLNRGTKTCGGPAHRDRISVGDVYGKWTVLKRGDAVQSSSRTLWQCQCSCGRIRSVVAYTLLSGHSRQCKECVLTTHGLSNTTEYQAAYSKQRRDRERSLQSLDHLEVEFSIRAYYRSCVVCGLSREDHLLKYKTDLHVDHVRPSKPEDGTLGEGIHSGNVCILCAACNTRKHNKILKNLPPDMRDKILTAAAEFKDAWEAGYRG